MTVVLTSLNFADVVKDVRVSCNSEDITLTISTWLDSFNGLVYPKGLSKNSTCMTEYIQEESTIVYVLTLRSCNTMSTDVVSTVIQDMKCPHCDTIHGMRFADFISRGRKSVCLRIEQGWAKGRALGFVYSFRGIHATAGKFGANLPCGSRAT